MGSLSVMYFTEGGATVESVEAIGRAHDRLRLVYPRFSTFALVTGVKLTPPAARVRERSAELDQRFLPNLVASAIVIESNGLAAVVARSFMAAFGLLSPRPGSHRTFSTVEPAVEWLQKVPGQNDDLRTNSALTRVLREASQAQRQSSSFVVRQFERAEARGERRRSVDGAAGRALASTRLRAWSSRSCETIAVPVAWRLRHEHSAGSHRRAPPRECAEDDGRNWRGRHFAERSERPISASTSPSLFRRRAWDRARR